ncbi:GAF domain-containing protein [Gallibacterium melopsittaci]|uniref:GAF domain-containing protein n=1 Tax=Gallibacterium melopsittaci TaxID=516063 RepID=A0ABV6HY94_9PAST
MFSFSEDELNNLPDTLQALITDDDNLISVLANTSALLNQFLPDINWVGFYLLNSDDILTLGPFQGKVACTRIPVGKGVCGQAIAQQKVLRIDNVHQFDGHIACDSASNSEIVLPIYHQQKILGVLDIDSPKFARFTQQDQDILEQCINKLEQHLSTISL